MSLEAAPLARVEPLAAEMQICISELIQVVKGGELSSKFSLRIWLAKPPLSRGATSGASLSMPLLALPVRW
jgi:hypothetical protein